MRFLFITIILGVFIFLPTAFTLAQTSGIVPCEGPNCRACDVIKLGQNLLTWFIGIMASIIALVFAWGGLKMVMAGGETSAISEAKGMMTNAIIGFIILLGSWLIINAVLLTVTGKGGLQVWGQVQCVGSPARTNIAVTTPTPGTGTGTVTPVPGGSTAPSGEVAQYSCAGNDAKDCVPISSTNIPNCIGGTGNRIIDPGLAQSLEGIGSAGGCISTAGIEQGHANPCHTTMGNCVDVACGTKLSDRRDCTLTETKALQAKFRDENLWPVYEFPKGTSQETLKQYRDAGVCAYIEPTATGAHFSVYVSKASGSGQYAVAGGCSGL